MVCELFYFCICWSILGDTLKSCQKWMKEMMAMVSNQAMEVPLEVAVEDLLMGVPPSDILVTFVFILVVELLLFCFNLCFSLFCRW